MKIDGTKKINTTARMSIVYQLCMFAFEIKNDAIIMHKMHKKVRPVTNRELNTEGCFNFGRKSFCQIESSSFCSFSSIVPLFLYLIQILNF